MGERADAMRQPSDFDYESSTSRDVNTDADVSSDDDPEQIREEIENTRAEMSETIDAIQERLNPQRIKEEATEAVREATIGRVEDAFHDASGTAKGMGATMIDTMKKNPIATALAGVGIGWLVMNARSSSGVQNADTIGASGRYRQTPYGSSMSTSGRSEYYGGQTRYQSGHYSTHEEGRAGQVQERAGEMAGQVQERVGDVADQVQERASHYTDEAQHQMHRAQSQFNRMLRENPLMVGAAALGLGLVAGLAIPETEREQEWMGEARDSLIDRAQETAHDTIEKVQNVAEEAKDAAQREADQQGLSGSS